MINRLIVAIGVVGCIWVGVSAQDKKLSELSQLKAENLRLSAQLSQCQVTVNSQSLKNKQAELEQEFSAELGCKKFDWQVLGCADDKANSNIK